MVSGNPNLKYTNMINSSNIHFLLIDNKRLDFKNSRERIVDFHRKRINHFFNVDPQLVLDQNACVSSLFSIADISLDGYVVVVDIMNPFLDHELVYQGIDMLRLSDRLSVKIEGAIPGTEPGLIIALQVLQKYVACDYSNLSSLESIDTLYIETDMQYIHNNQLNLYKYKRLKQFFTLISNRPDIALSTVNDVINVLDEDNIYDMLFSFGEQIRLVRYDACPYCKGTLMPLRNYMSQPFCGYLSSKKSLYYECVKCSLVISSPCIHSEDVYKVYDEWDKQDFMVSTNNPYTENSVRCNFDRIIESLPKETHVLDLGGGIGFFSGYLQSKYPSWNVTHSDFEIKATTVGDVQTRTLDFTRQEIGDQQYDIISAWEVLEHVPVEKLDFVVENIWKGLKFNGYFIFSTPDFGSSACKSFDFYALCPPFHYTVLSTKWLSAYFSRSNLFRVLEIRHNSDFLDDAINWYGYGEKTTTSMPLRHTSTLLKTIFSSPQSELVKKFLLEKGLGTEVCFIVQKIG